MGNALLMLGAGDGWCPGRVRESDQEVRQKRGGKGLGTFPDLGVVSRDQV